IRNAHIKVSFAGQFQSNVYVVAVIQRSRRFIELVRHLVLNCHLHTFRRCGSVILFQNGRYERTIRFFKSNLFLVWDIDDDVTSKQRDDYDKRKSTAFCNGGTFPEIDRKEKYSPQDGRWFIPCIRQCHSVSHQKAESSD